MILPDNISDAALEHFVNSGGLSTIESPSLSQTSDSPQDIRLEQILSDNTPSDKKYEGDASYDTQAPEGGYKAMEFASPIQLLAFFDDSVRRESGIPHKWQIEINEFLASQKPTRLNPLKYFLVANNGAGKDAYIIAPFAVWFCLCKVKSLCIITSSSGVQLTAQTESKIRRLCESVNLFFGQEVFRIRQRYIRCRLTGSEIRLFATDEAGKAEGYHPIEPDTEMAIIVDEAKSIDEEIYQALKRCNGYNYWLSVSTPGAPKGSFYYAVTHWKSGRRITSYDCPHINPQEIEDDKLEFGENSPLFRSKHLALFTSLEEACIIPSELIEALRMNPPTFSIVGWPDRVGIDLAAGGDEDSVCITNGNKVKSELWFRETDTTLAADKIEQYLRDKKIPQNHPYIFADDGGIGHAVIDMLKRRKWNITRVLNQWAALKKKQYGNRGAELWYQVKRILEENLFDITGLSEKTLKQLGDRQYEQTGAGRIFLESKKKAKAHGRPSPDRADAFILSLCGLKIDDFLAATTKDEDKVPKGKVGSLASLEEVAAYFDEKTFNSDKQIEQKKRCNGSLQLAMGLKQSKQYDSYEKARYN